MKSCAPKDEVPQKFVAKIQHDHRICKVKKVFLPAGNRPAATAAGNFEEAKATSKARKRKERQESVGSQYQDRKVIRSNSEERPVTIKGLDDKTNGMRRVSSSGDFPKSASDEKIKLPAKKHDQAEDTLTYDDHEHDKRRSHERFARPHTFKSRRCPNKRFKTRPSHHQQSKIKFKNDAQECCKRSVATAASAQATERHQSQTTDHDVASSTRFLDLHHPETQRSPSPTHTPITPVLDFATLHEQVDCSEPLLSQHNTQVSDNIETMPSQYVASNRMLSSPRNSIIATHRIYLDPDVQQTNLPLKKPVDERLQKLNKQINTCKKKILASEVEFEAKTGTKPSQFDKLNDDVLRKLYVDLSKLKKEQRHLSEMQASGSGNVNVPSGEMFVSLRKTVKEIEQKLTTKRESANRNFNMEAMTSEELIEEKIATQKALLFLESVHGRPQSKEDRDIVRPFYDRYRALKRMVAKISNVGTNGELATIHENEAMHFVTPTSSSNETESEKTETHNRDVSEKDSSSVVENLHSLTKPELLRQVKIVAETKKDLRRKIKEFEITTQAKMCRMLTRDDKKPMEDLYVAYKKVKGQLRLLEALVAKY